MLVQHGVVRRGKLHSLYATTGDGDGFSGEYLVDGISDIVIHTHCDKEGKPRTTANAAHWKPSSVKKLGGRTHRIPNDLRDLMVDREELVRGAQLQAGQELTAIPARGGCAGSLKVLLTGTDTDRGPAPQRLGQHPLLLAAEDPSVEQAPPRIATSPAATKGRNRRNRYLRDRPMPGFVLTLTRAPSRVTRHGVLRWPGG